MKRFAVLAAVVPTLVLSACGALFNGGPANVAFNSNPSGAQIWIDGTNRGVTPATLPLAKNKSYTVTFKKEGFPDTSYQLDRKISAGYVILDVLGGVIPIVVDAATGSWYVLSTKEVNVELGRNAATSLRGQLTPEQLGAARLGTPVSELVDSDRIVREALKMEAAR